MKYEEYMKDKYISDFSHNKILGGHAKCCALNGFTHFEWYNKRDVIDFIEAIKEVIPNVEYPAVDKDGNRIYTFLHDRINKLAGKELVSSSKPKTK